MTRLRPLTLSLAAGLILSIGLSIGVAQSASAQIGYFQEVSVPSDSAHVIISDRYYDTFLTGLAVVREGQQDIAFSTSSGGTDTPRSYYKLRVRIENESWQTIYSGQDRTAAFEWTPVHASGQPLGIGAYDARVEFTAGGNAVHGHNFKIVIIPGADRAFVSYETYQYNGSPPSTTLKHTILHWASTDGGSDFDQPLLVVEGVDAANASDSGAYYALGADGISNLFPRGQAGGADIAILNFGDGGRDIRHNAAVVDAAIVYLRSQITDQDRSLDVAGVSMGGVVARYALAKMEQENRLSRVASFVSIDAPQQGAVIDANLQYDLRNGVAAEDAPPALTRRASLQLLQIAVFDQSNPSEYDRFYGDIQALNGGHGYPRLTDNVGVSFGAPSPNPDLAAGTEWLRLNVDGLCQIGEWLLINQCYDRVYNINGVTGQAGSFLPREETAFFGSKLWRLIYFYTRRNDQADPTFIPYDSALDRTGGLSAFDAPTIDAPVTSFHNQIPEDVADDLLHRLGYELPPPPSVTISGPSSLGTGQRGYWRAGTPDPMAGYQYTWSYSISLPSCQGGPSAAVGPPDAPSSFAPQCGESIDQPGDGAVFSYSSNTSLVLTITVTATGSGASVTNVKTVCIGACYGGGLEAAAVGSGSEALLGMGGPEEMLRIADPEFSLDPAFPNPYRAGSGAPMTLGFTLPEAGAARLAVYDALGREVAVPYDGAAPQGRTEVSLDGAALPPGIYLCRLTAGTRVASQRITLVR